MGNIRVLHSSVIDVQRETLANDIWDKVDGGYVIKENVRSQIVERVTDFCKEVFNTDTVEYVKGIYIISSIATYFYSEETDIDIKIVINHSDLVDKKPGLSDIDWDSLLTFLIKKSKSLSYMSSNFEGSARSIDWFFYDKEDFDSLVSGGTKRFDSIYDILNRKFIKFTPKISDVSSTEIMDYALDISKEYLESLDIDLGELKRNTVLYDYYKSYLGLMDFNSDDVGEKVEEIIDNIEKCLEGFYEDKEYFSELRKNAFNKESLIGAYAKLYKSENFSDANLLRKILEYFGYWKILVDLSDIHSDVDDGQISVDDDLITKIENILKEI